MASSPKVSRQYTNQREVKDLTMDETLRILTATCCEFERILLLTLLTNALTYHPAIKTSFSATEIGYSALNRLHELTLRQSHGSVPPAWNAGAAGVLPRSAPFRLRFMRQAAALPSVTSFAEDVHDSIDYPTTNGNVG